ncbi:MAG: YecH family protein [Candidatus Omnitrophica bacterium]|nr:YecH family protein [Candidatus Omnitrophota bacterium]
MTESIHGHAVMELMLTLKESFTKESLRRLLHEKFGKNARYHTCSVTDMDAGGIIDFLHSRGKFINTSQGFQTDRSKICNH